MSSEPSLDPGELLARARGETGLVEFDDPSPIEPLEVLTRALCSEARLNAGGRYYWSTRLLGILMTRLRGREWFRRHPEILDEIGVLGGVRGVERFPIDIDAIIAAAGHEVYQIGNECGAIGRRTGALKPGLAVGSSDTDEGFSAGEMRLLHEVRRVGERDYINVAVQRAIRIGND